MPECCDAKLLQVLVRQAQQDGVVYLILAEGRLILPEAQAPQPDHDVHDDVPIRVAGHHGPAPRGVSSWGTRQPDTSRLRARRLGCSTEPRSLMSPPHPMVLTNWSLTGLHATSKRLLRCFVIFEAKEFERGGLMQRAVHAHMLQSACLGIDPKKQIDLARGVEHLFLHLA
jgi:hypothetical protein